MKIVVAIAVYNRFQNIKRWINCWKESNTTNFVKRIPGAEKSFLWIDNEDAELVIIHNHYNEAGLQSKFQKYCEDQNIKYVPRNGLGFDIGALQDVFKERLNGFPNDWDYLLWACDDTLPMSKDFITPFLNKMQQPGIGVAAMQLSKSVSPHIRTSGFCISKEVSKRITFAHDPIKTKEHCYFFEHRGGIKTFTNQVRQMGLSCEAVAPINISPLWDSDHPNQNRRLDRHEEFNKVWGIETSDKVVFICPIYNMYPQIISALICQTHKNWELLLIHNGPLNGYKYDIPEDPRIKFIIYPEATGQWGHVLRQWALMEIKEGRLSDADYICIQNADNYLVPPFTEYLLKGFKNYTTVATYCSETVHSYKNWHILPAKLERGFIDCGAVIVKKEVACEVGWNSLEHSSDWTYFSDIASKYSWSNFSKISGALFVHNVILGIFISCL